MRARRSILIILVAIGIVLVAGIIFAGVHYASDHYLSNAKAKPAMQCPGKHVSHLVLIQGDAMVPEHTQALLCDTLTITNKDDALRLVAFGPHDDHQPYDGVTEKLLKRGQSLTITLNKTGTYQFHDHLQDVARGDFTVMQ